MTGKAVKVPKAKQPETENPLKGFTIGKKECGECTECCKVMGIVELEKPPGSWCSHARKGKGCGIYETRPDSCRSFECIWLQSQNRIPPMPMKMRPDKTKIVLTTDTTGEGIMVHLTKDNPTAYAQEPSWSHMKHLANHLKVHLVRGDRVRRLYPDGHMQDVDSAKFEKTYTKSLSESDLIFEDTPPAPAAD